MQTTAFTAQVLKGLKKQIQKKTTSLSDVARIAREALLLADAHPEKIPDSALKRFFVSNPDAPGVSGFMQAAEEAEQRRELEAVRSRLLGKSPRTKAR